MAELRQNCGTVQLHVEERALLILGGELGNSVASSRDVLERQWAKLAALHLNTVLLPIYWELLEPVENEFDFHD